MWLELVLLNLEAKLQSASSMDKVYLPKLSTSHFVLLHYSHHASSEMIINAQGHNETLQHILNDFNKN